jgi:hypothetical protein
LLIRCNLERNHKVRSNQTRRANPHNLVRRKVSSRRTVKEENVIVRGKTNKKIRRKHPNKTNLQMLHKSIKENQRKHQTSRIQAHNRRQMHLTNKMGLHNAKEILESMKEGQVTTKKNPNKDRGDRARDPNRNLRSRISEVIIVPKGTSKADSLGINAKVN